MTATSGCRRLLSESRRHRQLIVPRGNTTSSRVVFCGQFADNETCDTIQQPDRSIYHPEPRTESRKEIKTKRFSRKIRPGGLWRQPSAVSFWLESRWNSTVSVCVNFTAALAVSTRYSQGPGLITHYSQGSLLPKSIIAKVRVRVSVRVWL